MGGGAELSQSQGQIPVGHRLGRLGGGEHIAVGPQQDTQGIQALQPVVQRRVGQPLDAQSG